MNAFYHRAAVVTVLALALIGSACDGNELTPTLIPGTENLRWGASATFMSVSPDERWFVFLDADSGSQNPMAFHLVTMNLTTFQKTQHNLRKLPEDLRFSSNTPWQAVAAYMEPAGWIGDIYYVYCQTGYRKWGEHPWVAFTPGVQEAGVVEPPRIMLQCTDGLSNDSLRSIIEDRGMQDGGRYEGFSAPVRNGKVSSNLYTGIQDGDGEQFVRVDAKGTKTVLFEHKRSSKEVHLSCIRVSPDERYLAYAVIERKKMPIPWPGLTGVYVFDMESKKTFHVEGVFDHAENLMWSPDSKRLYFTAANYEARGACRVDMNNAER